MNENYEKKILIDVFNRIMPEEAEEAEEVVISDNLSIFF
jgi:hypothetical protein